jgi:peroxiredoxin
MSQLLALGTAAPDFRLRVTPDRYLSLSELRGRRVILSFYPADWSSVCGDQITLYNQVRPEFQNYGAEILGISVDGAWCHQAYAKHNHIHFPLLADFNPKGATAQKYGAYREQDGVCERALFVIDPKGVIFWSYLSPIAVNLARTAFSMHCKILKLRRNSYGNTACASQLRRPRPGSRQCAGDTPRIWRLRMPVLRPRLPSGQTGAAVFQSAAQIRISAFPADGSSPIC